MSSFAQSFLGGFSLGTEAQFRAMQAAENSRRYEQEQAFRAEQFEFDKRMREDAFAAEQSYRDRQMQFQQDDRTYQRDQDTLDRDRQQRLDMFNMGRAAVQDFRQASRDRRQDRRDQFGMAMDRSRLRLSQAASDRADAQASRSAEAEQRSLAAQKEARMQAVRFLAGVGASKQQIDATLAEMDLAFAQGRGFDVRQEYIASEYGDELASIDQRIRWINNELRNEDPDFPSPNSMDLRQKALDLDELRRRIMSGEPVSASAVTSLLGDTGRFAPEPVLADDPGRLQRLPPQYQRPVRGQGPAMQTPAPAPMPSVGGVSPQWPSEVPQDVGGGSDVDVFDLLSQRSQVPPQMSRFAADTNIPEDIVPRAIDGLPQRGNGSEIASDPQSQEAIRLAGDQIAQQRFGVPLADLLPNRDAVAAILRDAQRMVTKGVMRATNPITGPIAR